jgi:hypothetical protein
MIDLRVWDNCRITKQQLEGISIKVEACDMVRMCVARFRACNASAHVHLFAGVQGLSRFGLLSNDC